MSGSYRFAGSCPLDGGVSFPCMSGSRLAVISLSALGLCIPENLSEQRDNLALCVWIERGQSKVPLAFVMREYSVDRSSFAIAKHKSPLGPEVGGCSQELATKR